MRSANVIKVHRKSGKRSGGTCGSAGAVALSKSSRVVPNSGVWNIGSRRRSSSSTGNRSGSTYVNISSFAITEIVCPLNKFPRTVEDKVGTRSKRPAKLRFPVTPSCLTPPVGELTENPTFQDVTFTICFILWECERKSCDGTSWVKHPSANWPKT
jgi:hypothetical protein